MIILYFKPNTMNIIIETRASYHESSIKATNSNENMDEF